MSFIKKVVEAAPAVKPSMETNIDIDVNEGDTVTQTDPLEGRTDQITAVEPPVPVVEIPPLETDVSVIDEIASLESIYETLREYKDCGMSFTQSHVPLMIHALKGKCPKGLTLSEVCPSLESDNVFERTDLTASMEGVLDKIKSALKKTKEFFFKPKISWEDKFKRIEARLASGEEAVKSGKSKVKLHMRNGTFDFDVIVKDTKQAYANLEESRMNRFFKVIKEFDDEIEKELGVDRLDDNLAADNEDEILHWITREAKRVNPTKFFVGFEKAKIESSMVAPNYTFGTLCYKPADEKHYPSFTLENTGKEGYTDYLTLSECKELFSVIKSGEDKMVKDIGGSCFFVVYLTCIEGINQLYYACEQGSIRLIQLIEQSLGIK